MATLDTHDVALHVELNDVLHLDDDFPMSPQGDAAESIDLAIPPSKLPEYKYNTFLNIFWKAIESHYYSLRKSENLLSYNGYGAEHRRSKRRFYIILNEDKVERRAEDDDELRAREDEVLALLKTPTTPKILTEDEFNRMEWFVDQDSQEGKWANQFFTDLKKIYSSEKQKFLDNTVDGHLTFTYKIFKHVWFMGGLRPIELCPDSHEDIPGIEACGGCTSGDVVFVHMCTCASHNDAVRSVCYAQTNGKTGGVEKLVGRFVCQHGPSSVLVFEKRKVQNGLLQCNVMEAVYAEFETKMPIENPKLMHSKMNAYFTLHDATKMRANPESRPMAI